MRERGHNPWRGARRRSRAWPSLTRVHEGSGERAHSEGSRVPGDVVVADDLTRVHYTVVDALQLAARCVVTVYPMSISSSRIRVSRVAAELM